MPAYRTGGSGGALRSMLLKSWLWQLVSNLIVTPRNVAISPNGTSFGGNGAEERRAVDSRHSNGRVAGMFPYLPLSGEVAQRTAEPSEPRGELCVELLQRHAEARAQVEQELTDRVRPERADDRQQQGTRPPLRHGQRNVRAIRGIAQPAPTPVRDRGRKSLDYVPLKGRDLMREGDAFRFAGHAFRVFSSRPLPDGKIKDGTNFAQDARGNGLLDIVIEVPDVPARPIRSGVGIDLGLKDFVTLSTGEKLPNGRSGRRAPEKLATAQRARKHKRHISGPF